MSIFPRRLPLLAGVLLVGSLASQAAAQDLTPSGPLRQARTTRGDTTVVRTLSGSTWGDRVRLVEELRIGSLDDGPDSFGFIQSFVLLRDGGVAVFDGTVPAIRVFDRDGRYLRTLGREGAGPGEYRDQTLGILLDPAGNLLMYDPNNSRINRWSADGTVLPSILVPGGSRLFTAQAFQTDTTGTLMVKVLLERPEPGKDWRVGLLRLRPDGQLIDTLLPPVIEGPAVLGGTSFSPSRPWLMLRDGGMLTGYSWNYALTVTPKGGRSTRIERAVPRIRLTSGERADFQAMLDARQQQGGPGRVTTPPEPVPAEKPAYRSFQVDQDGRIWVQIYMPAEQYTPPPSTNNMPPIRWREPAVWDVFRPDGTYLGQVRLPWRTSFRDARGNQVWTVLRGADDESYLVRYRIVVV